MRKILARFTLLGVAAMFVFGAAAAGADTALTASELSAVFRVRAVEPSGKINDGSAVLIAQGELVTTCHVTRHARLVEVSRDGKVWAARPWFTDAGHDLCVLYAPELTDGTPAIIAASNMASLGDDVFSVGYPGRGQLSVTRGQIKGLHKFDGSQVIQVSAAFDHGQSGGALFDRFGQLIGITAFKALTGGDFHFALPLDWITEEQRRGRLSDSDAPTGKVAFWEKPRGEQPLFLQAASLEADREWQALSFVARQWVTSDSENACSWLTLGRALSRLKRHQDAAIAFDRAAKLDPSLTFGRH